MKLHFGITLRFNRITPDVLDQALCLVPTMRIALEDLLTAFNAAIRLFDRRFITTNAKFKLRITAEELSRLVFFGPGETPIFACL
ncbi:hypothetical protein TcasGA2_TC001008 [Tribolium castaneum]|uniref:Uncharacterized protein n=1 Tax=Tribolium castaneum TaxID=7070 RepID=D6W9K8_TRICA|nr:hypothetical protein TcasGA2_TC001008 [Tribolium castaneum]